MKNFERKNLGKWMLVAGWLACMAGCSQNGCQGPAGPAGPMGPSGTSAPNGTPIYYYNQNFDGAGYSVSEWKTNAFGGLGIGEFGPPVISSSVFQSPPNSLRMTLGSPKAGDMCYVQLSGLDTSKDTWVECDWMLNSNIDDMQVALNINSGTRLVMGYSSLSNTAYLINSGTQINVLPNPSTSIWHHIKMVVTSAGLSSYWFDNLALGSNYNTNLSLGSEPNNTLGLRAGVDNSGGGYTYLDNLQCYHY